MILNYYNDLVFTPTELFLNKDFGQVATVLGALHGQSVAHLICCEQPNPALSTFAGADVFQAAKRLHFLSAKFDFLKNLAAYGFLIQRRGQFSHLVMFPFCPTSDYVVAKLFLVLNPGAKIIVKLDANYEHLEQLQSAYSAKPRSCVRQHFYYRRILDLANAVIYETRKVGRILTRDNFLGICQTEKFLNIYNGISRRQISAAVGEQESEIVPARGNVIVLSGRLGAPQKNVELIFQSNPVPPGWRLKFIGPLDSSFYEIIAKYRKNDPDFDLKYEFTGEIADKRRYYKELSTAKILLLCSNWEGFPMVYSEAHYFGLYIVTTDVGGSAEATDDGRIGTIIPRNDSTALREALLTACSDPSLQSTFEARREYSADHFIWERSLRTHLLDSLFSTSSPAS